MLQLKFAGFEIITRSRSVAVPVSSRAELDRLATGLLKAEMPLSKSVRLLGISLSSLQTTTETEPQLDLPI